MVVGVAVLAAGRFFVGAAPWREGCREIFLRLFSNIIVHERISFDDFRYDERRTESKLNA